MMEGFRCCSCTGRQRDGDKCNHGNRRCRRHVRIELRIAKGACDSCRDEAGPWFGYCTPCAEAIQASGMTNELEARDLEPVSQHLVD